MPLSVLRQKDLQHAPRFQLWTDAICFREMAKQAPNTYLSSMCVRNAILSAWTTLEMACCDALEIEKLGMDFRQSLDAEFDKKGIPRLDFGSGIWNYINSKLKEHRKVFTHFGVKLSDRFPPVSLAEEVITKVREAIRDFYVHLGKQPANWVALDQAGGWPERRGTGIVAAHLTVSHAGATPDTPGVVNIVLVTPQGEEKPTRYLPPDASDDEIFWWVEDYLGKLNVPFKAIRVYRGDQLIHDETLEAR
jgi:hypothetical protein